MAVARSSRLKVRPEAADVEASLNLVGNDRPGQLVYWLIGYMALFIIRPWEVKPELAVLPIERIFALAMLVRFFGGKLPPLRARAIGVWGLTFLSMYLLSTFLALDVARSWISAEFMLRVAIITACIALGIQNAADVRTFVLGWIGISWFYQAKAIWEYYVNGRGLWRMGLWRMIGIEQTFFDPNTFAATTYLLLPFVLMMLQVERKRWMKLFLISELVLAAVVIVKTGSRGGLIGASLGAILVILFSRRRFTMLAVLGTAAFLVFTLLPPEIRDRYVTIVDKDANKSATESAEGRKEGFWKGLALLEIYPFLGVGPGCFVIADNFHKGLPGVKGLQPHNIAGEALGETGLMGSLSFLGLVVATGLALNRTARSKRKELPQVVKTVSRAAFISLLLLFWNGVTGHNLNRYNWYWMAGLAVALARIESGEAGAPPGPRKRRTQPPPESAVSSPTGTSEA